LALRIVRDVGSAMEREQRFGYRIMQFKLAPFHLISQLDMNRLWDRVLRRAGLPVLFSRGFNPRPLVSFAPATPLGVESKAEYLDVFFAERLQEEELRAVLNRELPPELGVHTVRKLHPGEKKVAGMIRGFLYTFYFSKKIKLNMEDVLKHLPDGVSFCSSVSDEQTSQQAGAYAFSFVFEGKSLFLNPFQLAKSLGVDVGKEELLGVVKEKVLFNNKEVSRS